MWKLKLKLESNGKRGFVASPLFFFLDIGSFSWLFCWWNKTHKSFPASNYRCRSLRGLSYMISKSASFVDVNRDQAAEIYGDLS